MTLRSHFADVFLLSTVPNNGKFFFSQIMTVRDKWIVVRAIEIQQKLGVSRLFFEIIALQY